MAHSGTHSAARQAYTAYGADLIRSGCILLGTTPSVGYRAATLFQRFQHAVDRDFRAHYTNTTTINNNNNNNSTSTTSQLPSSSSSTSAAADPTSSCAPEQRWTCDVPPAHSSQRVAYVEPAEKSLRSSLHPLHDLFAPMEVCVAHVMEHNDVSFLAAACVLVAAKMEDPGVRISHVVGVFVRLSERRCGVPVNDLLRPPPEYYEDFKACVSEAETILLHQLGFHVFVECPIKHAILFLNTLVEGYDPATGKATEAYKRWISRAVCWINDVPRCAELVLNASAALLGVCAIQATADPLVELPKGWWRCFGVRAEEMAMVEHTYASFCRDASSSVVQIARLVKGPQGGQLPSISSPMLPDAAPSISPFSPTTTTTTTTTADRMAAMPSIPATLPSVAVSGFPLPSMPPQLPAPQQQQQQQQQQLHVPQPFVPVANPYENMEFEDLREVQKRRRREEKERHAKRQRSGSAEHSGGDGERHRKRRGDDGKRKKEGGSGAGDSRSARIR